MKKLSYFTLILLFPATYQGYAQQGCTDVTAINYNKQAIYNDGSCRYNDKNITPKFSKTLPSVMSEASGLIIWDNKLWTHNDDADINLYAFTEENPANYQSYPLKGAVNYVWEEIDQDDNYVYIGDFGNSGNRRNLMVLRVEKTSLLAGTPQIDSINFSYATQEDFTYQHHNTDFDCAAFIVTKDSIYLFTKEWISEKTTVYSLPKIPGNHIAQKKASFDVKGLVTGATYRADKNILALCGYSGKGNSHRTSFIYLFYDFNGVDFFSANKRKLTTSLSFHQVEGIVTEDGVRYYVVNERVQQSIITIAPEKLHLFDLKDILPPFTTNIPEIDNNEPLNIYPNPANQYITVETSQEITGKKYHIRDINGRIVQGGSIQPQFKIDISHLKSGVYIFQIKGEKTIHKKFIKQENNL
ncbi:MAG: T9SS type A sorting domain-containing protein [Bacteroidetes bacterium]|nr:T9SS type A sorting domain-containing protein [Bacteroidota bacterium]